MSFRTSIAINIVGAAMVGILLASTSAYLLTKHELTAQIDRALREQMTLSQSASAIPPSRLNSMNPPNLADQSIFSNNVIFMQVITTSGVVLKPNSQQVELPKADASTLQATGGGPVLRTTSLGNIRVRMISGKSSDRSVVQIARSLDETDTALHQLVIRLIAISGAGLVLAFVIGIVAARRNVQPILTLTTTAEAIADTQDLTMSINERGNDELARLGRAFNRMVRALRMSKEQQQRLIVDASHELRTPLTIIRANVELLERPDLPAKKRASITKTVVDEVTEFDGILNEIVLLANEQDVVIERKPVVMTDVVARCAERLRRRAPDLTINVTTNNKTFVIEGDDQLLERAVGNVLDNARKWSPPRGTIEVVVGESSVTISDQGPGISDDDLTHVTERFYRSPAARSTPGSGLGLSIVLEIVERHGGQLSIGHGQNGGTAVTLSFPQS